MSSLPKTARQRKDYITTRRIELERDRFISSISKEDVCRLATSLNSGIGCDYFQEPVRGSYNVCYFVQFGQPGPSPERWVVRVPIAPCLAAGTSSKLESEVVAMQHITEKTSIPIPKIYSYAIGDGPEPLSSYLILEYIEGKKLSYGELKDLTDEQRTRLYASLADAFAQLRRLEFPSIGRLVRGPNGPEVRKKVATIDMNTQELDGLDPSEIQESYYRGGLLKSASDYTSMLLDIADNAFAKYRGSVTNREMGQEYLYNLDGFRQHAQRWVDPQLDQGPFVLVHGDFELFNLLVKDDMSLAGILDWEWSRVVPLQFFKPPVWLAVMDTKSIATDALYRYRYLERFAELQALLRTSERERYGNNMLAEEWEVASKDSGILVAEALENWSFIDWFAAHYLEWTVHYRGIKVEERVGLEERVRAFMDEDPTRYSLIERQLSVGVEYEAEVKRLISQEEICKRERASTICTMLSIHFLDLSVGPCYRQRPVPSNCLGVWPSKIGSNVR